MAVLLSIGMVAIAALHSAAALQESGAPPPPVPAHHPVPATRARAAPLAQRSPTPNHETTLEIDTGALRRHVTTIAKLVGRPAHELIDQLAQQDQRGATVGDGMIEWNLVDVGVAAGSTYGYASVVDGKITGILFRGRTNLDALQQLKFPHGIQLTRAGGERPSFSIVVGD